MAYEFHQDGSLNLYHKGKVVITLLPEDEIGILYDNDGARPDSNAMLLKHGKAEDVLRHYQGFWRALMDPSPEQTALASAYLNATQSSVTKKPKEIMREIVGDLKMIRILVNDLNAEMVNEINKCLETTGRIGNLQEKLLAMTQEKQASDPKMG